MPVTQRWIAHDFDNAHANLKPVNPLNHVSTQSKDMKSISIFPQ